MRTRDGENGSRRAGKRSARRRLSSWPQMIVVVLIMGLVGAMAAEPARQLLRQRERISAAGSDLRAVRESNRELASQIRRLKNPDYIDEVARAQMGLVKPGELPYVVLPRRRAARAAAKQRPPIQAPEEQPGFVEGLLRFIGAG